MSEEYVTIRIGDEDRLFKKKQHRMRYAGAGGGGVTITLPFDPRSGVCAGCGKSRHKFNSDGTPEIKLTSLHHWKYAYAPETVKKTPILILDNTVEVCFACHQVADGLRGIMKMSPDRALAVMKKMPKDLLDKFAIVCNLYLEWYKKQ